MTFDIVLVMPNENTMIILLQILLAVGCLFASVAMISLKEYFAGIILACFGIVIFWCLIYNGLNAAIPIFPYPWNEILYNMLHPEPWFNFTVVWPK